MKNKKIQGKKFKEVKVPLHSEAHIWSVEELDSVELLFDGGDENNPPLEKPVPKKPVPKKPVMKDHVVKKPVVEKPVVKKPWKSVRISAGELFVPDTKQGDMGLVYHSADGKPEFISVPRKVALQMTGMDDASVVWKYCESLGYKERTQRASLVQSKGKQIYSDHKLCNPGVGPRQEFVMPLTIRRVCPLKIGTT